MQQGPNDQLFRGKRPRMGRRQPSPRARADSLDGRLEKIYVVGRHVQYGVESKAAHGYLRREGQEDQSVIIDHANPFYGMNCLVRFDIGKPFGNFVSTQVPENFQGLGPKEYILFGVWEQWMKRERPMPILEEVEFYFDPGKTEKVYCNMGGSRGKAVVRPRGQGYYLPSKTTYSQVLRLHLPNPDFSGRLVILGCEEKVEHLEVAVAKASMQLIRMETFRETPVEFR